MKTFLLPLDMWIFKEVQAFSVSEMMGIAKSWKGNENEWCGGGEEQILWDINCLEKISKEEKCQAGVNKTKGITLYTKQGLEKNLGKRGPWTKC